MTFPNKEIIYKNKNLDIYNLKNRFLKKVYKIELYYIIKIKIKKE